MVKLLTALLLVALIGAASAAGGAPCERRYKTEGVVKGDVETVRFQSLNDVYVIVDEEAEHPTVVLYADDKVDSLQTLNTMVEGKELTVGAANGVRTQCVHLLLPSTSDVETLAADDNTTVTLVGTFSMPSLKLAVINGFFFEANTSDTSMLVEQLTVNNTGVGGVYMWNTEDQVSDLDIANSGNGDTWFLGSAGNGLIHHEGIGNVQLGKVSGSLEVHLTGQGDIGLEGSKTLVIEGAIKHPYRVVYEHAKSCDLEAIQGNSIYSPCKKASDESDD